VKAESIRTNLEDIPAEGEVGKKRRRADWKGGKRKIGKFWVLGHERSRKSTRDGWGEGVKARRHARLDPGERRKYRGEIGGICPLLCKITIQTRNREERFTVLEEEGKTLAPRAVEKDRGSFVGLGPRKQPAPSKK